MVAATLHGLDGAEAGLVALLLALATAAWVLTERRMGGMAAGRAASSATSAGSP